MELTFTEHILKVLAERETPADGTICQRCGYPYEEHGGLEGWCVNVWDEDTDWSLSKKFKAPEPEVYDA